MSKLGHIYVGEDVLAAVERGEKLIYISPQEAVDLQSMTPRERVRAFAADEKEARRIELHNRVKEIQRGRLRRSSRRTPAS